MSENLKYTFISNNIIESIIQWKNVKQNFKDDSQDYNDLSREFAFHIKSLLKNLKDTELKIVQGNMGQENWETACYILNEFSSISENCTNI
ncbi:MAG: hypothetical protein IKM43_04200 [Clostridia bacterium]|nr:hypothetical protein [Clostridia bacterium]